MRKSPTEKSDQLTKDPDIIEWFGKTREERARGPLVKKLLMVPRGCFKSTIASVAFPLWAAWHNQDLRIMIDSESMGTSKKFLAEQQGIIELPLFKTIVSDDKGDFVLQPDTDRAGGWTEKDHYMARIVQYPLKRRQSSVQVQTQLRQVCTPDIIIMDDMVSERNVTTKEQIEKVKQHYKLAFSLLEPGGLLIIIGTRYHMNDLYNDVLQDLSYNTYYKPSHIR